MGLTGFIMIINEDDLIDLDDLVNKASFEEYVDEGLAKLYEGCHFVEQADGTFLLKQL
jgi:hypothetical protein